MNRRPGIAIAVATLLLGGMPVHAASRASALVYFGTDGSIGMASVSRPGSAAEGPPQGIHAARLDARTGHLSPLGLQTTIPRATWQVADPAGQRLYSVADSGGGIDTESLIYGFAVDRASAALTLINRSGAGGRDATHLTLDARSHTLFVANHASGDVTALPLSGDGSVGAVATDQKTSGTGPHRRQAFPQPHAVALDRHGRHLIAADFGADRLYVYRFDAGSRRLQPASTPTTALPAGSGPRHLAFSRDGRFLYVNTELTAMLYVFRWDARTETLTPLQALSAYPAGYDGRQERSSAELVLARDGRYLYVSLRGDQNSLVVYAIDRRSGALRETQRIASQGQTPRSFAIDPSGRWLLVANQASNTVDVLQVDTATGRLSATGERLPIPRPVTVVFAGR